MVTYIEVTSLHVFDIQQSKKKEVNVHKPIHCLLESYLQYKLSIKQWTV